MPYRVTRGTVRLNGKKYAEGAPLPLDEDDQDLIAELEKAGAIEAFTEEEKPAAKAQRNAAKADKDQTK